MPLSPRAYSAKQSISLAVLAGLTAAFFVCYLPAASGAVTTYTGVYAGGTIAPNDTVVLNNGARITGNVITNGTLQFNQSGTNLTVSSTISGTGTLSLTNTGTLTLFTTSTSSETTLPSTTTVSLGCLSIGNSGTGRLLIGETLTLSGGSLVSADSRLFRPGPQYWPVYDTTVRFATATITSGSWINNGNLSLEADGLTASRLSISGNGFVAIGGTVSTGTGTWRNDATWPATVVTTTGTVELGLGGTLQIGLGGTTGVLSPSALSAMNGTLAFNRSDSVTYAGAISGSGSVVQMGSGALTLSGNNTYSGTTQVLAGTLVLAGSSTSPLRVVSGTLQIARPSAFYGGTTSAWTAPRVTVDNGSTLSLDVTTFSTSQISQFASLGTGSTGFKDGSRLGLFVPSGTSTYSNSIADTNAGLNRLGLVKSGSGTLVLTASSSYTGGTYIESGTLQLGSGGSIQGNVQNNGALELNRSGTFSLAGTQLSGSGSVVVRNGTLSLSGSVAYTGRTEVFDVLQCTTRQSLYGGDTTQWTANNIRVSPYAVMRLSVGGTNEFTAADIDVLRTLGTGSTGFMDGSTMSLDTTNAASGTFIYAGAIANTNGGSNRLGISKRGAGTLVLLGSNSYTGGTGVSDGMLQIGNGGNSGSIAGDLYTRNGVIFNRADSSLYSGNATLDARSGTAGFTKLGAGKLTVSGSITSYGDVRIAEGAVEFSPSGSITVPTNSWNSSKLYVGGSASSGATLTINGGNFSSWVNFIGADNTYGTVNLLSGTMNADGGLAGRNQAMWYVTNGEMNISGGYLFGPCSVSTAGRLNISGGRIEGPVTGDGAMTMSSGTLWNSSVTVGSVGTGTLNVSGGQWASDGYNTTSGVLGNTATGNGLMTLSGGTIGLTYLTVGKAGVGRLNIGGGSLVTNFTTLGSTTSSLGAVTTYGGTWLNTGSLIVGASGAGTLIVSGSGDAAGTVVVGGTLSAGGLGLVSINGGGTLRIGTGGTTGALSAASVTNHGSLVFNRSSDSSCACVVSGSGSLTKESAGALTLSGANSYSGGTTLNAGSLIAGHMNAFGSGTVVVNSGTLNLASLAIANQITNNGGTIINAANYGGTQSVAGVVSMTGTVGGTVNVANTGELKGSGVVFNGPVTLASGAQHSPGDSPGTQTFTDGLTYSTGSILNWELISNTTAGAGTNYDFLSVTGGSLSIDSGAVLNLIFSGSGSTVSWSDSFWNADHSWTIIDAVAATSSTGDFSLGIISNDSLGRSLNSIREYAGFALDQSGNNVVLTFTAVPEPSTYVVALVGVGISGWAMRRRRSQRARTAA